ncbi:hypothetical protein DAY19_07955 [Halobacteriovorax vibrionivorans]|uniref:Uncharacterized protein n=1 Tax=Halobacteriovorax vibrionivorans TaxID=2152716 RepID=A0ABY0IG49_9BACT|nr:MULTISPECIES: hypothetical protein [Halobacteriovorax]RZF21612.1 hypothetical protein DAY19_07955 [Halobacteriovorax vibrionivorans]TGD49095.1 hypothetical protein EP118_01095 [Halobacteriovorax sp. Y22]
MKILITFAMLVAASQIYAQIHCKDLKSVKLRRFDFKTKPYQASDVYAEVAGGRIEYTYRYQDRRGMGPGQLWANERISGTNIFYDKDRGRCNAAPGFRFLCKFDPIIAYDTAKVTYNEKSRELKIVEKRFSTSRLSEWELEEAFYDSPADGIIIFKNCREY